MDLITTTILRGNLDAIILLTIKKCDKHTNQIRENIVTNIEGKYQLKQGTYYSCLQRIVKQGFALEYRITSADGVRRKFYKLTSKGQKYIDKKLLELNFSDIILGNLAKNTEINTSENKSVNERLSDFLQQKKPETEENKIKYSNSNNSNIKQNNTNQIKDTSYKNIADSTLQKEYNLFTLLEDIQNNDSSNTNNINQQSVNEIKPKNIEEKTNIKTQTKTINEGKVIISDNKIDDKILNIDDDYFTGDYSTVTNYHNVLKSIFPTVKQQDIDERQIDYNDELNIDEYFNSNNIINNNTNNSNTNKNQHKNKQKYKKEDNIEVEDTTEQEKIDFSDLKLLASTDGFKLKISNEQVKKKLNTIAINKLNLSSSLIFYGIFFMELLLLYFTTSETAGLGFLPYFITALIVAIFPITIAIITFINPNKHVSSLPTLKSVVELCALIMVNLAIITIVVSILTNINFSSSKDLMVKIFYPVLIILNIPIYFFIKYLRLDSKKYLL